MLGAHDLDAVVVHHDAPEQTLALVGDLLPWAEERGCGVWVVDNGGRALPSLPEGARILSPGRNLGYAGGLNFALAHLEKARAEGCWLLGLNADLRIPDPEGLTRLLELARSLPTCGAVGPALIGQGGAYQVGAAGFRPSPAAFALHFLGLAPLAARAVRLPAGARLAGPARALRPLYLDQALFQHAELSPVDWVCGAAWLLRRDALRRLGGFPQASFLYAEDLDLGLRLQQAGYSLQYASSVRFVHAQEGSQLGRENAAWLGATLDCLAREREAGRVSSPGLALAWSSAWLGLLARACLATGRGEGARAARRRGEASAAWSWARARWAR